MGTTIITVKFQVFKIVRIYSTLSYFCFSLTGYQQYRPPRWDLLTALSSIVEKSWPVKSVTWLVIDGTLFVCFSTNQTHGKILAQVGVKNTVEINQLFRKYFGFVSIVTRIIIYLKHSIYSIYEILRVKFVLYQASDSNLYTTMFLFTYTMTPTTRFFIFLNHSFMAQ